MESPRWRNGAEQIGAPVTDLQDVKSEHSDAAVSGDAAHSDAGMLADGAAPEKNGDSQADDANGAAPKSDQDSMTKLETVDGLRGLGALLVVAYHLRFGVRSAWVCIGLFFALSGLLMTSKVLQIQAVKGEFSVLHFWRSRTLRLIPALLALVLCILAKTYVEWSIYGKPSGVEIHYMREDLLWAVAYGENWNLIDKGEEYFADIDTSKTSVVRHIWSLSIEEQYYILWPVIFAVLARGTACSVPAADLDGRRDRSAVMSAMLRPDIRNLVKVLCLFEVAAIVFSQFMCVHIYRTTGETAAYFSTYARAGEFAVGGLSACLLHASPWSLALFIRDPDRPSLTRRQRVGLEFASATTVLCIMGASVIPMPLADLLDGYFRWFRLPFTILVLFGGSLTSLQTSEPLPPWAVFTKFTSSRLLVYFGSTSYGLYLVHWVLIVWFGDSEMNTIHSSATPQGREPGAAAWARDLTIAAASIAVSSASFCWFERPLMVRAGHLRPVKVIAISFASMAAVAGLVVAVTQGAKDPNRVVPIEEQLQKIPIQRDVPVKVLFLGDSQAQQIADKMMWMSQNASINPTCADLYGDQPWGPRIINGGRQGFPALQTFGSKDCKLCRIHVTRGKRVPIHPVYSVQNADAPYIVVMETHFLAPWHDHTKMESGLWGMEPHLKQALYNFIQLAAWHGAQHVFLCTSSPYARTGTGEDGQAVEWRMHKNGRMSEPRDADMMNTATRQRMGWLEMLESFKCKGNGDPGKQRVLVSLLDYHKLVCPDFDEVKAELQGQDYRCDERGPGFEKKIKADIIHPTEEAGGYFLVRQLQRVLMHGIERQGTFYSEPFRTPPECYDREYDESEEVSLQGWNPQDLLTTFEVCVDHDEKDTTHRTTKTFQHENITVDLSLGQDIYMCKFLKLPKTKVGTGITRTKLVMADDAHKYVHHLSYLDCDVDFEPKQGGAESSFACTHDVFINASCSRMIHTFSGPRSTSEFQLPDGYMYSIVGKYQMLQVHYKPGAIKESRVDSTGVTIHFGRFLKTVQYFEVGPRSGHMLNIPPKSERYAVQSVCSADELATVMDRFALKEFEIIAGQHHMHLAGVAAMSEVIHPNGTTTPFRVEKEFDMHHQDMKLLPQRVLVSRGDALKVTCVYNTKDRSKATTLGISVTDEMCYNYVLTTPRLPLFNNCWHMEYQVSDSGDTSSFGSGILGGLLAGSASSGGGECRSMQRGKSVGKAFTVPPRRDMQGPEADAARADVFQGLPPVCQDEGRRLRGF